MTRGALGTGWVCPSHVRFAACLLLTLLPACERSIEEPLVVDPAYSVTVYGVVSPPAATGTLSVLLTALVPGCAPSGTTSDVSTAVGADGAYRAGLPSNLGVPGYYCVRAQVPSSARPDSLVTVLRDSVFFGVPGSDSVRIDLVR